jgi:hypothetical protein
VKSPDRKNQPNGNFRLIWLLKNPASEAINQSG